MTYHLRPIMQTSATAMSSQASSVQYAPSSAMNSSELYFSNDVNPVDFETVGITINDDACSVLFKINKELANGGQYEYKFLAFDDLSSDIFHKFDQEWPPEEWQDVFYSRSAAAYEINRAFRRRTPQKVNLSGTEVVLMTGRITSEFTNIEIEDFNVKDCFHGIFIFFNKEEEAHSSWIVNYSHDEKIINTDFLVEDLRTAPEEDIRPGSSSQTSPLPLSLSAPLIKFYTTPYDDETLGIIIFVDIGALLQKKSWNSKLLTIEEIKSSIKSAEITKYRLKNKKVETIDEAPSEGVDLVRVDFNALDTSGIVSFVARDPNYLARRAYEYEFLITFEDPTHNKVEKIFNELKSIHEVLSSVKKGLQPSYSSKKYFAQIIDLASQWYNARTSVDEDHYHTYTISPGGAGKALFACNPGSAQVCHRHAINDKAVVTAQSSCYPKCEDKFGVPGARPHTHTLPNSEGLPCGLAFIHRLATDANSNLTMKNVEDVLAALGGFLSVVELKLANRQDKLKLTQNSANPSANVIFSERKNITIPAIPADKSTILPIGDGESITKLKHLAMSSVAKVAAMSSTQDSPITTKVRPPLLAANNHREDVTLAIVGNSDIDYTELAPNVQLFVNSMVSNSKQGKEVAETPQQPTETISFESGLQQPIELEILTSYFINKDVVGISDVWSPLNFGADLVGMPSYSLVRIKNSEIVINKYFVLSNI